MSGSSPLGACVRDAGNGAWDILRRRLRPPFISLYPLGSYSPGGPDLCAVCRGPARPGCARCYQCARHELLLGPGLLADAVMPISYAVKGTAFAADLWRYKSWLAPSAAARMSLLALLLAFLHDHGACAWRQGGMPAPRRPG